MTAPEQSYNAASIAREIRAVPSCLRAVFIYALIDPETNEIRYIGKTTQEPSRRLLAHLRETCRCHRTHWINSLKSKGLRPGIIVLEMLHGAWPWQEAERFWIAHGRASGWPLTNNTSGGDGVPNLPPEARERMRLAWLGRKRPPETLAKMRAVQLGRKASLETRAKMSRAHTGRKIAWVGKIAVALRRITPDQAIAIRQRLAAGETVTALAAEFGVHRTTLSKIKAGTYFVFGQGIKGKRP
jgi:NUMOD3 motif